MSELSTNIQLTSQSAVRHFYPADFSWEGITPQRYKAISASWRNVARHKLSVDAGPALTFEVRYFEIGPGGFSSCEFHQHEHVVICLRGCGRVILSGKLRSSTEVLTTESRGKSITLRPFDLVYIAPHDVHQFRCDGDEPFGFLCIVNRDRDRPQIVDA
jgi:quercetin dioxygenase-like cupin family protein